MRERIKKLIALVMTVLVLNQLPGFDAIVLYAASVNLYADTTVSVDTEDTYVFASGGVTLTVDAGVTVGGVDATIEGSDNSVQNSGTINSVNHTAGNTTLNGGYYGSIYVAEGEGGGIIGNSISAGIINADGPIHLEGANTVASLTAANDLAGTGTITVTDELSIPGTSTTIMVDRNTVINATYEDITVYYNDTPYTIAGGTTGNTIAKNYGVYVTFDTIEGNTSWSAIAEVDNINSYLFPGEEIGKYSFVAAEGFYFPDTYTVTTTGQGTLSVTRIDEKEIQITYIVADTDSGTVQISLPALNPLELGMGSITVPDVYVGETFDPVVESETNPTADVTVEYKVKDADDETYSLTAPTAAGDYVARAILPAQGIYGELIITDEFSILKREGLAELLVSDVTYGETVSPVISSESHDVETAIVEYKISDEADTAYTATIPTAVGEYSIRVTIPSNASYEEIVLIGEFSIYEVPETSEEEIPEDTTPEDTTPEESVPEDDLKEPVSGSGSLIIADAYYGTSVVPQITSNTNSTSGITVEYKVYGKSDATYTAKAPSAIGRYVARVVLPGNENYKEVVLTDEFSIGYLPVPENSYSIIGNVGENGYYTSEVIIVSNDGYVISDSLDGEYAERITINSSSTGMTVYIMDENTGAKTNGIAISAVNIDMDAPEVDANNDSTYYGDSLAVAVWDNNLASITLNGKAVEVEGTRTILELKSDGGIEEYIVVVTDTAGHTKNMTITIAAEWTKTGEIPNGTHVKLEAGKLYTLGTGIWSLEGDNTSYSGDTTFCVGKDGKYIFNKH